MEISSLPSRDSNPAGVPVVSVIIPAYNTAPYIAETLASALEQTYRDYELIVINDGSPDSPDLEKAIAPFRDRIVYITQQNGGGSRARNNGIHHARGEYLAFLDSDDCWLPEYLASQMDFFARNPYLDVVYCDASYFGDPAFSGKTYMQIYPSRGPVALKSLVQSDSNLIMSCTIVRKSLAMEVGLFDESLRGCEDYDLWLRLAHHGARFGYQTKVLGRYRLRREGFTRDPIAVMNRLQTIYEKVIRTEGIDGAVRRVVQEQLDYVRARRDLEFGKKQLSDGNFYQARESFTKANEFFHSKKLRSAVLGLELFPRATHFAVHLWHKLLLAKRRVAGFQP